MLEMPLTPVPSLSAAMPSFAAELSHFCLTVMLPTLFSSMFRRCGLLFARRAWRELDARVIKSDEIELP